MISRGMRHLLSASVLLALPLAVSAQEEAVLEAEAVVTPLYQGAYLAPMASYVSPDDDGFDDGIGGTLALGYRKSWWAVEGSAFKSSYGGANSGEDSDVDGGSLNALVFPFKSMPNLFGLIGAGALSVDRQPMIGRGYSLSTLEGGAGYIFPLSFGRYEFGIRADARYRYGSRQERVQPDPGDLDLPKDFGDVLVNLGLQLPLGLVPPPPPPPEPVAVVASVLICSDGLDNDGDGLIDYPADPGCTSAEDGDETDPPQCSDGKDNDGDGLVDFPADKGCTGADDTDETDPCKTPEAGERVSLKGCGLGDVIVLRGVNFEFDKARLTPNAKTILDNVAEELVAYPEITIELGGHTDAKGSDEYNQSLSERRAASVVSYLEDKGVAADRMTSAGYGEAQPVADNETDESRELNRRVELKITSGIAPGSATTVSDGSTTTVTGAVTTEPAVETPAADAPAAGEAVTEEASVEAPLAGEVPAAE